MQKGIILMNKSTILVYLLSTTIDKTRHPEASRNIKKIMKIKIYIYNFNNKKGSCYKIIL